MKALIKTTKFRVPLAVQGEDYKLTKATKIKHKLQNGIASTNMSCYISIPHRIFTSKGIRDTTIDRQSLSERVKSVRI